MDLFSAGFRPSGTAAGDAGDTTPRAGRTGRGVVESSQGIGEDDRSPRRGGCSRMKEAPCDRTRVVWPYGPPAGAVGPTVERTLREYGGSVRLVVKHLPYRYRDFSNIAAEAALAARD